MDFDEDLPEEDMANASRDFFFAFSEVDVVLIKALLSEQQFENFESAMDLYRQAQEKLRHICDGPTSWGMAAGYREGHVRAADNLRRLAKREGRDDIAEWLSNAGSRASML